MTLTQRGRTGYVQRMAEHDGNPYAAPESMAGGPAPAPPRLSLANRVFSTAFITFATFLALGLTAGLLIYAIDPQTRATEEPINPSGIAAYLIVISGLYGFGFWLRRNRSS
ncbi:MAG: hypothetical protein K2Y37_04205 [Pirellulales bacterium]|nr:hypothetical protein [Pirellulales bacterium]